MTAPVKHLAKLGDTRRGPKTRIWLEGKRLIAAGFTHGTPYVRVNDFHGFALEVAGKGTGQLHVAGSKDRPVIDLTGAYVADAFMGQTHVEVTYTDQRIVIKGAA